MTFVLIDVIDSYRLHKRLWTKSIVTFFLFGKTVFFQVILVILLIKHGINLPVLVASVKIRLRSFFV
jgi:hypothetical protein